MYRVNVYVPKSTTTMKQMYKYICRTWTYVLVFYGKSGWTRVFFDLKNLFFRGLGLDFKRFPVNPKVNKN